MAFALGLSLFVALLHGLLYAWLVPPWQTPDEPTQFEYAALVARLGRLPTVADRDLALEAEIAASLEQQRFFEYLLGRSIVPAPQNLEDVRQHFFLPRQVGADPPLYFVLAALPLRLLANQPIDIQLAALRLLGVLLLPGLVYCVARAAGELITPQPAAASTATARNGGVFIIPQRSLRRCGAIGTRKRERLWSVVSFTAGLCVALQPMVVFTTVGVGNDGLANLLAAAFGWALLRSLRLGLSRRRLGLLVLLAGLGLLTKRTLLPPVLVLGLVGLGWLVLRWVRSRRSVPVRLGLVLASTMAILLGGWLVLAQSIDPATAAGWNAETASSNAARVVVAPGSGTPALVLPAGQIAVQALPDVTSEWAQNQVLHVAARVWATNGEAQGQIVIDYGWAAVELPFRVGETPQVIRHQTLIPLYAPYLHVALRSAGGSLYADQLSAESERRPGLNLLDNADLRQAGVRAGSPPAQLGTLLRLRELGWLWRSGRLFEPPPLGWDLARIFFVSFWGQFGWMSLPLVGNTAWEPALGLLCIGGLLGTFGWLSAPWRAGWQRVAMALLLLWLLAGLLLPLLNAYTQPRSQTIQQGRYLFSALVPLVLVLVVGWRTLLPHRWQAVALAAGVAFGLGFAGAALRLLADAYQL